MPTKLSKFWQELKRRKVIHVIVVYASAAFVIIELVNNVYETLNLPEWTPAFTLIILAIGFPLAIIFSWIYERSSEGLKRTNALDQGNNAGKVQQKEVPTSLEKSIIVLPFENISSDPEQEYFSDGLTEEIITDLSYINDLLVISRSSAMTFKGTKQTIKEIAKKVNVRYVLEGSVRKSGNDLRIVAQLIDAENDAHIWAEKYNGTIHNIFALQEKISLLIAEALEIQIGADTKKQIREQSIKDPFVYEIYLKARYENWQFNELSFNKAESLLLKGLEIAGDNELLYVELCHLNIQYINNLLKDPNDYPEILDKAKQYAEKASKANPESALAHYVWGFVHFQKCNPVEALKSYRNALLVEPDLSEPMLFLVLGYMYSCTGLDLKQAEIYFDKCVLIDPITPISKTVHAWGLIYKGEFQRMVDTFADWKSALEQVKSPMSIFFAWTHGLNNEFDEAFRIIDVVTKNHPDHPMSFLGQFLKYAWQSEIEKALSFINPNLEKAAWWDDLYALMMADGYSVLKEYDQAFLWLNRAIDYGIINIDYLSEYDPFLENIRTDKRFKASLKRAEKLLDSIRKGLNNA